MECFFAWAAFAFALMQWWTAREERDHYRDSYHRVIDQWCESLRRTEGR